jgi:L-seryl-tRNA(Ser) seleniumtransferase
VACESLPGAGSTPGASIPSFAVQLEGDHLRQLRRNSVPVIARVRDDKTLLDLRTVDPADDHLVIAALSSVFGSTSTPS